MWGSLWQEVGSVVFNCCWASPAQPFSGLSPSDLSVVHVVHIILRPTDSQPVRPGVAPPSEIHDQIFITVGHLRLLLLDWREDGSVIYSYNLLSLSVRSPAELTAIFYCLIWDSPNLDGHGPVFISPRKRVAQLYFRAFDSLFVASYYSPLWSSGQSSWLQIRRPGFDSRHYQKNKVVGLERGPLILVSTT
jgi:hypothetical protein